MKPTNWISIGAACCFAGFWVVLASPILEVARGHDFLNLYTGASLAAEGRFAQLHDPAVQLEREEQLAGPRDVFVPFVRPHFYAAVLAPLAAFPFGVAFGLWIALHVALLLAVWCWAGKRWGADAVLLAAMYLPAALGIAHAQDGVFLLWIVLGSYLLAERHREFGAGAVLALALFKFHLVLLMPLGIAVQKRWRMLAGFSAVAVAELLFSIGFAGVAGARSYIGLLSSDDIERLNPSPERWISLYSFTHNFDLGAFSPILLGIGLAVAVGASLWAIARGDLARLWVVGLSCSLLIAPHVYGYDAALLLLPLLLVLFGGWGKLSKVAAGILVAPLTFLLTIADAPWAAVPAAALALFVGAVIRDRRSAPASRLPGSASSAA